MELHGPADLHCHILPHMDDGADNSEVSLEMLRQELSSGVDCVAFTPHFAPWMEEVEHFVNRRARAFSKLSGLIRDRQMPIAVKEGAEVCYVPELCEMDISGLNISNTPYILVELPTDSCPPGVDYTISQLANKGYIPILAHVERYDYVLRTPALLYQWVHMGAVAQVNADSIRDSGSLGARVAEFVNCGLVHLVASDAHSPGWRHPNLDSAYKRLPPDVARRFRKNSLNVFLGKKLQLPEPEMPKFRFM